MVKGFIFKYSADPDDPLMKDKLGTSSVCRLGLRDPDFWSNNFPVWAVCGPYYRKALVRGDIVFFVSKKSAVRKAGLDDYLCTGILVVAEKLPRSEDVMTDTRITSEYKKKYRVDLAAHLERDARKSLRTAKIRQCNFILGDSSRSIWVGKKGKYLPSALQELEPKIVTRILSFRRIPVLEDQQAKDLYRRLVRKEH